MSYVKQGEVVVKVPLSEQLRNDIRTLAFLDGIPLKAKVAMLLGAEVAARSEEIDEIERRRKARNN
jgi:hypothetical protein